MASPGPGGRRPAIPGGAATRRLEFWRRLAREVLDGGGNTPFYVFAAEPVQAMIERLDRHLRALPVPVRHWLSCKTQPVAPLLDWWHRQGRPIEVVSEFEFLAARAQGFAPEDILLNGPAKDRWLTRHALPRLRVNFDSPRELEVLLPWARRLDWSLGLRLLTDEEVDPADPNAPTQFGFTPDEAVAAMRRLTRARARLETVHFHLRTNVASPRAYGRALRQVAEVCAAAKFAPRHLDGGGGLPPPRVRTATGQRLDATFALPRLADVYRTALADFPGVEELWLENGRFVTAGSGVLVVRLIEVKQRRGWRQLIADGGRTLNALVASWEQHELAPLEARRGRRVPTAVYGPTCMAFDQLARRPLPASLRLGDRLIWLEAGAYHVPWETRFSHGAAAVYWHERNRLAQVRAAEEFAAWWGSWQAGRRATLRRATGRSRRAP